MPAGNQLIVDKSTTRILKSGEHHRNMGLDTIANYLDGTNKWGSNIFYNNFLSDVIANYIVFKMGNQYDALMRRVFQDKVKIEHEVMYENMKIFKHMDIDQSTTLHLRQKHRTPFT